MLERSGDEEQVAKLKKDLKRTKALLKDAQLMLEKSQNEGTNKVIMRQLKNQVQMELHCDQWLRCERCSVCCVMQIEPS